MRRTEQGHHHIAGTYLARYTQESAWREDHRRDDREARVWQVAFLALRNKPSVESADNDNGRTGNKPY